MRKLKVPTLSEKGYIEEPRAILAYLLSCYIATDVTQSFTFDGALFGLSKAYADHINSPMDFEERVRTDLEMLLMDYFEHVETESAVKWDPTETKAAVVIYATILTNEGERIGLGNLSSYDVNGLGKVIEINNFGDGRRILGEM